MAVAVAVVALLLVGLRLVLQIRRPRARLVRRVEGGTWWSTAPLSRRIGMILIVLIEAPLLIALFVWTPVGSVLFGSPLARACGGLVCTVLLSGIARKIDRGQ